jgi:hypothetical protein
VEDGAALSQGAFTALAAAARAAGLDIAALRPTAHGRIAYQAGGVALVMDGETPCLMETEPGALRRLWAEAARTRPFMANLWLLRFGNP